MTAALAAAAMTVLAGGLGQLTGAVLEVLPWAGVGTALLFAVAVLFPEAVNTVITGTERAVLRIVRAVLRRRALRTQTQPSQVIDDALPMFFRHVPPPSDTVTEAIERMEAEWRGQQGDGRG